jgi:hypothetical protein
MGKRKTACLREWHGWKGKWKMKKREEEKITWMER